MQSFNFELRVLLGEGNSEQLSIVHLLAHLNSPEYVIKHCKHKHACNALLTTVQHVHCACQEKCCAL